MPSINNITAIVITKYDKKFLIRITIQFYNLITVLIFRENLSLPGFAIDLSLPE
jgi:hypothetical protein